MNREWVELILGKEEQVLFIEGCNVSSYIVKKVGKTLFLTLFLGCFFSLFVMGFTSIFCDVNNPFVWFYNIHNKFFLTYLILVFGILVILCLMHIKESKIIEYVITNKRIIIRCGGINFKIKDYDLSDLMDMEMIHSVLDEKGEKISGDLIFALDQYNVDKEGRVQVKKIHLTAVNNVMEAFKILREQSELLEEME